MPRIRYKQINAANKERPKFDATANIRSFTWSCETYDVEEKPSIWADALSMLNLRGCKGTVIRCGATQLLHVGLHNFCDIRSSTGGPLKKER
jgi:hypothetical protein